MIDSVQENLPRGRVLRGLPRSLDRHDPVSIGSDRGCDIVIEGADPHHAELRWDADMEAWFVHDDPAPGLTLRNEAPIDSSRMFDGDTLEIAGVNIRFSGSLLEERVTSARLQVTLCDVSATAGGKKRLQGISFDVAPGNFVAILGPSGCGKSTLIQRIAGLAPYEGGIYFNGHELRASAGELRPLMAYLPQAVKDTLYNDMTVREAMTDFARCHLATGTAIDFKARLADVGIADKLDAPIAMLSGGEMRRLALALALLREPQLLLLDEPTDGLDPAAEAEIMALLRRIADQGRTVMCATHVLGSLDKCDKVVLLAKGGRQVAVNTPARALAIFGTIDWCEVYRKLGNGEYNIDESNRHDPPPESPLPAQQPPATFSAAFGATFRRLVRATCAKRTSALFLGIPIGVALVLSFACQKMFEEGGNIETVCFCMAVAMFWLGLSGAVRSLVVERIPKRCLDRMRGVPLVRYFAAHVAFTATASGIQALVFVLSVFLIRHHDTQFSQNAIPAFWVVSTAIGFAGACVGLAVSACAKKELHAVWAMPFVAILALFLSKPVLHDNTYGEDKAPEGVLRVIECAMPTFYAQECLASEIAYFRVENPDKEKRFKCRLHFTFLALAYSLLLLTLAYFLQNWREEEWNGR